ncbi:MAG TPA: sulfite exporter TauE/SafE family protein [Candidatus Methylomirabilis sp.]|nr:sulfite exporter TauE/SafE family protein [Candidatus Methylomirabilis sp.]
MSAAFAACLASLGFVGAFIAGLLGIGGAIIMIPLLLYVPGGLGLGVLDMKMAAALSMAQVFFAAAAGAIFHGVHGTVHRGLAICAGAGAAVGSLLGGIGSRWISSWGLLLAFALMATLGAGLMWAAPEERAGAGSPKPDELSLSRPSAVAIGVAVGVMAGLVGAGGAFLLIPLLITVLKVPTRLTIGSSLAITLWPASTGFLGKLVTAQIPFGPAVVLVLGALPGIALGEWASRRTRVRTLRGLLTTLIALAAIRVWIDVVTAFH